MKFHPNGKWIYVLNELSLTVSVFDYDAALGTMKIRQTIETVPQAALEREESQKLLRDSGPSERPIRIRCQSWTRHHHRIRRGCIFWRAKVDSDEQVRGSTPRNFNLTPDGQWLLAAGQLSNTLAVFSLDATSGKMTFHQQSAFVPTRSASCLTKAIKLSDQAPRQPRGRRFVVLFRSTCIAIEDHSL